MNSSTGCLSTPSVKTSTLEGSWKCVDLGTAWEKWPQNKQFVRLAWSTRHGSRYMYHLSYWFHGLVVSGFRKPVYLVQWAVYGDKVFTENEETDSTDSTLYLAFTRYQWLLGNFWLQLNCNGLIVESSPSGCYSFLKWEPKCKHSVACARCFNLKEQKYKRWEPWRDRGGSKKRNWVDWFTRLYSLFSHISHWRCDYFSWWSVKSGEGYRLGRSVFSDTRFPILYHVMCLSNETARTSISGLNILLLKIVHWITQFSHLAATKLM